MRTTTFHDAAGRVLALFVGVLLLAPACGRKQSPKGVADRFLYLYLIEINQQKAKELTSGLAESKLEDEIESLKSIRGMDIDLSENRPFIDYKLLQQNDRGPDRVMFLYEVKIKPRTKGVGETKQTFLVSTVRQNGRWQVDNFESLHAARP